MAKTKNPTQPYDMQKVIDAAAARRARVREMRSRGLSLADIAKELGVSRGMSQKLVQRAMAEIPAKARAQIRKQAKQARAEARG